MVPVNFVLHGECLYFHCAPQGEKLDNIEREPRICFEVDEPIAYIEASFQKERNPCKANQLYRSVIIRGKARVVKCDSLKTEVLNALVAKYEGREDLPPVDEESSSYKGCCVVEIIPEKITGKANLLQAKPLELRRHIARKLLERGKPGDIEAIRAMGFSAEELGNEEGG